VAHQRKSSARTILSARRSGAIWVSSAHGAAADGWRTGENRASGATAEAGAMGVERIALKQKERGRQRERSATDSMSDQSTFRDAAGADQAVVPRLALAGISKQYPSVRANDDVHLAVAPGEIHAVLGENGAGKSTLMKIIYGSVRPDAGEIRWEGELVEIGSPAQARKLGIGMVFQHFIRASEELVAIEPSHL